jgi:translation initiation factor 2 gamma subunit (eIF-2gamma)
MRSREVRGSLPDSTVQIDIAVRSHIYTVEVPVHVILADDRMTVTGSFQVNQTDLGLVPFSVMMGALKVKDQLDIRFTIVAEAARPAL